MTQPHPRLLHRLAGLLAAAALAIGIVPGSLRAAALPAAVGGQPMPSLAPMLTRVTPAVVNISTTTRVRVRDAYFDDPMVRQFFGLPATPRERVEQSLGSGVIVDAAKGYVLTNNHVVGGADDIQVTLQDGRSFKAKLIGTDPETDVAVVQIPAQNLKALPLADSSGLQVGDYVVAVGDPFGLGQTVTAGIVSALGRSGLGQNSSGSGGYQNFIQTDASINPGNSGGALVNLRGELVGINTMIFSPSGGNVGIGFAIPSNLTSEVMAQLLAHGKVQRGSLGVQTQAITPRIAKLLGLKDSNGVVVTGVGNGSAGEHAGLQPGDVLTTVNGKPLRDVQELHNAEGLLPLGSTLRLGVLRDGKAREVNATLTAEKLASIDGGQLDPRLAGVRFSELSQNLRSQGWYGVAVSAVQPGSHAARAGLSTDDVVIGVGGQRITSLGMLRGLAGVKPRQLVLVVTDGEDTRYVVVN
ncbi:Do family serine endopeptidase [Rhodanobacter denitrificans]|uniref:Do family serine endopeptidase n=1 Tax=Rhodanobacter denitrificans TaxID=666685 RepID=A0A368KCE9_9GAMM|nr:Do family serine endopeptidase [Rhodanobacter denitrificans]RCS28838.1 Do family serine endopeptidase [Rhodanobacter denitrificans]